MYISIEQAIDLYNDLIDAKNDNTPFGENEMEIYVYKLMPYAPMYSINNTGAEFDDDNRMAEKKAAEDFHSICYIFNKKHNVEILIDEMDIHKWISKIRNDESRFFQKVRVIVKPKNKKDE